MPYQALARQWRPKRFAEIVGQTHTVTALSHALSQNKLHHAYLFTGTHGVGKTTLARIFAKCLNCETGVTATPCDQCGHCTAIDAGRFPDLLEIDAASRTKVEDTRDLLDSVPYAPTQGRFKIYLIDEVHMLSGHSFNALLKTLEEPPAHVKFLLATTDPQKLPVTVLSRCLQFHLTKITPEKIASQLALILKAEKIPFETDALTIIAKSAEGSMRDALSLLDQCIAYGNGEIKTHGTQAMLGLSDQADLYALLTAVQNNDAQTALSLTQKWADQGVNFSHCLIDLLTLLYQISLIHCVEKMVAAPELKQFSKTISLQQTQRYYQIALLSQRDLPIAPTPQIGFEMMVMRLFIKTVSQPTDLPPHKSEKTPEKQQKTDKNDWHSLLSELKLTGPTLALAQQCALKSLTQDEAVFLLQPKYAAFNHERHRKRIEEVLTQRLNRPTRVIIHVEEHAMETPAHCDQRLQEASKQSAKESISADAGIQRIVKTFDAVVIENSIEPHNH